MSKNNNPEIDLMILDSLEEGEYKPVMQIAKELQLEEDYIVEVLQGLINDQELAVEQKGDMYRIAPEEDDYLEVDDE